MGRWFFRSRQRADAHKKPDGKKAGRGNDHRNRKRRDDRAAPLSWQTPEQEFITRYGDPFDS